MRIVNPRTGGVLAEQVEVADSFWKRLRGLMFRRNFEDGRALLFKIGDPRIYSVHTFFVFFLIDLVYLDQETRVVDIKREMPPWTTYRPKTEASFLVELPGGKVEDVGLEVGNKLKFHEK